jgi:hypothetical protein
MRPLRRALVMPLAAIGLLAAAACPGAKPIQELLDDPSRYEGQTVRIAGEVKQSAGAFGYGVYQVDDGTGTLTVIIEGGGSAPRVGAKVGVEGEFRSAFTLGTRTVAVLVEEKRRAQ